jgi:uncharacterized YigZ family protein
MRIELRVSNSRFIATADRAESAAEARALIAEMRAEMPDASHHASAYIIGHGATTTQGQSDDGEQSGTAGRPALAVLRGSGLGDVVLVVTRYFGGTLLGTGGLVRAYGDAAKAVVNALPRTEKVNQQALTISVPYGCYETARRLVTTNAGSILHEAFADVITLHLLLPTTRLVAFERTLQDVSAGQAHLRLGSSYASCS